MKKAGSSSKASKKVTWAPNYVTFKQREQSRSPSPPAQKLPILGDLLSWLTYTQPEPETGLKKEKGSVTLMWLIGELRPENADIPPQFSFRFETDESLTVIIIGGQFEKVCPRSRIEFKKVPEPGEDGLARYELEDAEVNTEMSDVVLRFPREARALKGANQLVSNPIVELTVFVDPEYPDDPKKWYISGELVACDNAPLEDGMRTDSVHKIFKIDQLVDARLERSFKRLSRS
ncbi:hypothetical protein GLAREA_02642 [Glarea lozoyensis ATCC 20868]|uniref:Uncharacterized protein n=1 Tax=Glarea lozoyensis (strain ATCC 20868 / MF5171) TaxID=1116229 RepID=S3DJK7_GLAL2|nr:uncharacterized protein GLAREA_02642 [Glarea lozoyensis ATCC 20868]EPE26728.1 hypothetical protein GLAREA_02642 [Glarea lozoyensis ATCC 20868]